MKTTKTKTVKKMTAQQFLHALRKTVKDYTWINRENDQHIRTRCEGSNTYCPVTAVAMMKTDQYFGCADYERAAAAIGLDGRTARGVACAADGEPRSIYRAPIMKALKLAAK